MPVTHDIPLTEPEIEVLLLAVRRAEAQGLAKSLTAAERRWLTSAVEKLQYA